MNDTAALEEFTRVFGVPEFLWPWLDRFFEQPDVPLVLALAGGGLSAAALRRRVSGLDGALLERAYRRGIVDRAPDGTLCPAGFHARFEVWALFEGWKDVPAGVRADLNAWELAHYESKKRPQIEALRAGRVPEPSLENAEYLLLHEAEALLGQVERVYLWPCNCRSMMGRCAHAVVTCLRFENQRGLGWEISRERARAILHKANRAGLMQTGEVTVVDGRVTGAICNCCGDCCYPHLVAGRLGAEKIWPRSRYVARRLEGRCTACGRCARRCPFGAFGVVTRRSAVTGAARLEVVFHEERCRGCGVCSPGCPADAIVMDPLPATGDGR